MKEVFARYKVEIFLFALIVGVRVCFALFLQIFFGAHGFVSFSDAEMYVRIANNVINHGVFSEAIESPELVLDAMRTPGYPALLIPFLFLGAPYLLISIFQALLAGAVGVALYRLSRELFHLPLVGIVAALFYAFEPSAVYWSTLLMSDHVAGFFFLRGLLFFFRGRMVLSGIFIGLTALIRPVFLYLFPLFLLWLLWQHRHGLLQWLRQPKDTRALLGVARPLLVLSCVFALMLAPWMLRNKVELQTFSLSSNGWVAIHYFITVPFGKQHDIAVKWPEVPQEYYEGSYRHILWRYEFSNHPFYKDSFLSLVRQFPFDYARFHLESSLRGFFKVDYDYLAKYVLLAEMPDFPPLPATLFMIIGQTWYYALVAASLALVFVRKYRKLALFLLSFPLLQALLTGAIGSGSGAGRYMLPFLPLFLMLGCIGILTMYRLLPDRITLHGTLR